MKLNVLDNALIINGEVFGLELNYSKFSLFNKRAELYKNSKVSFMNTIFYQFYIKKIYLLEELTSSLKSKNLEISDLKSDNILLMGVLKKNKAMINKNANYYLLCLLYILKKVLINFKLVVYILATIGFIIFKKNHKEFLFDKKNVAFINCNASLNKVKRFFEFKKEEAFFLIDDKNITPESFGVVNYLSFYNIFSKSNFIKLIPKFIYLTYKEFFKIKKEVNIEFNQYCSIEILNYSVPRIFQTVYIEHALSSWTSKNKENIETIYSGVRDERFSIIQQNIASKFEIDSICIPHGLAYSINYPKGIFGNTFYTSSKNEKKVLESNISHKNQRFVYDKKIIRYLYSVNFISNKESKIVFFTDARNVELDNQIIQFLLDTFNNVKVKLHPIDLISNYPMLKKKDLIQDFRDAISNNIVVSRNSTVLLEAVYNNSKSLSVLLSKSDIFNSDFLYPSLSHEEIYKIYSMEQLKKTIKNVYEEKY